MEENTLDITNVEPFEILKRPGDPDSDPLEIEFTAYPASTTAESSVDLSHLRWVADLANEHVNPKWDERFEVVAGEYRVVFEETETTLSEGDDIVIPTNTPHRHWNPSQRPARVRFEARPGLRGLEAFETLYTLAQAGKVNENGMPNLLQFAVIQDAYRDMFYSTTLPRSVQRVMFTVLAPIGRSLGYRARYTRDEIENLR